MPTLKTIKKRIGSVKSTQQITKAMYMVSAAKLRRAQLNAENSRPFSESLAAIIKDLVARLEKKDHPLLAPRDEKKVELVIFTSDRGLCGGFNTNLIKTGEAFIRENKDKYELIVVSSVGRRATDYFKRRRRPVRKSTTELVKKLSYAKAQEVADELTQRYLAEEVDAVYLIYPTFKSALTQKPTLVKLLPFTFEEDKTEGAQIDYIYEPSAAEIVSVLLPKQVRNRVYSAMLETVASEHGARMTAMDSATTNASEMINNLTLLYNRARQAAITKELMEIIGGAEALKG